MTTTTRKAKSYSDQNERLNILDADTSEQPEDTWFQNFLNKYAPTLRSKYEVEKGLLAKQRGNEWESMLSDIQFNKGLIASEENLDMYDDSPDKQDMLDIEESGGTIGVEHGWDSQNQDPIRQNERELSAPASSPDPTPMSPQMQKYALGLLKDYMEPDSDPAPQPVRGMGIIKGGGTPFPSLLQPKPERPRYVNKGLV